MNPKPITIQIQLEPTNVEAYAHTPLVRNLVNALVTILEDLDLGLVRSEVYLGEEAAPY